MWDKIAEIVSVKKNDDGTFLSEVVLSEKEHLDLAGNTNNLIIFSDKVSLVDANISQRGKNNATKYFLIPKQLRNGLNFTHRVSCQKVECDDKTLFVYVIHKML